MKRIFIFALLFLALLLSGCVSEQPEILSSLSDYPGTAVRIPSSTLKFTSLMAGKDSKFLRKLNTVEVFTCEDSASVDAVAAASRAIAEERGMELMIETRDSLAVVHIFVVESDKSGIMKEILIQDLEPEECNVVYVKGKIDISSLTDDPEDFKKLLKGSI